ncbi:Imm1 family immunity protein [Actinopolyspora mortivallis]|uniref:Imm1 family immunity protein n=1 Tax=Actinopolyspora mortivallis TaxID=33906 RepID=UPI00035D6FBD|nr:Imm1 family immunity protein [Actinopolyspora mortivallis]
MTTISTATVVTAVLDRTFHYAYDPTELDQLITRVIEAPTHEVGLCYSWDRPCRSWRAPEGEAFPEHSLRVATDPDREIGALSYHHYQHELLDSHNPAAGEETPPLLFDPEGDLWFPASASIPLEQARQAITEYCRTGTRPTSVEWQPGQ